MRKLVVLAATIVAALSVSATASAAPGSGASGCQPAAGQGTAGLAHALGGLGAVASVVASSQPGAIAALDQQDLINCA